MGDFNDSLRARLAAARKGRASQPAPTVAASPVPRATVRAGLVFDPADSTVSEVLDHVAKHPAERDAVLAAELDGYARKGIVEALTD